MKKTEIILLIMIVVAFVVLTYTWLTWIPFNPKAIPQQNECNYHRVYREHSTEIYKICPQVSQKEFVELWEKLNY